MELKEIAQTIGLPENSTEKQVMAALSERDKGAPAHIEIYDISKLRISEPEFDALKARHKNLYVLDVVIDPTESYQFITCRPSRDMLRAVNESKGNINKINDLIEKNMVVGGDIDALDDGVVYGRVMKALGKIVNQGQTFLGKA